DHVDHIVANLLHGSQDLVLEGAEYAVEIKMSGGGKILNFVVEEISGLPVVGRERIAGKKDVILLKPGEDGIGPMKKRGGDKAEGAPPQIEGIPILDGLDGDRLVEDIAEKVLGGCRAVDHRLRRLFQEIRQ